MMYINDKLLLDQNKDANRIQTALNSSEQIIKFTTDIFPHGNVHFRY